MSARSSRQPPEQKQRDMFHSPCESCYGTGRIPWACAVDQLINFYRLRRGLKPLRPYKSSKIDFQTCPSCQGSGRQGRLHAVPQRSRGAF
jgi:hypothetical protein